MTTPIRAVVGRFIADFSFAALHAVLTKRPFDFCAILSHPVQQRFFTAIPVERQEWFDAGKMRSCRYDGVDWDALAPVDEELIERMRDCEALFMEIVCRQEWKYAISYRARKRWYLRHLQFWNDYLTRRRINLYLSAWIPHEIPDIIIYHLCKARGIAVVYNHMSTERDTGFVERDIEESAIQISHRYEELLIEYAGVTGPDHIPLSPEREERYRALTAPQGEKPPLSSVHVPTDCDRQRELLLSRPVAFLAHALQYLTPAGLHRMFSSWKRRHDIRQRNAFYDAHAIEPDLGRPFVYLALHYQPEASTVPMAGVFCDQLLIARMLNALLPEGTMIYVKEHPKESSWFSRSIDYYRDFLELSKVRLVARQVDTFALRENCRAVATATGSVGFEGLFRGKPVFMFGHRFYQYARGVYRIHTNDDLKKAINDVFINGAKPTLVTSKLYLRAMDETRVKGTLVPWDRQVSVLSDEEHIKNNSEAFLEALERMDAEFIPPGEPARTSAHISPQSSPSHALSHTPARVRQASPREFDHPTA